MIYKEFKGLKLSALGFGMMRLPTLDGRIADIDEKAAAGMVDYAMQQGVNYYDTAWGYHDGNSELASGKLLSKYPRDSFYLASKFPGYDLGNMDKVEEIFEQQLRKCRVDCFDFYLFHNVNELNVDSYLDPRYGILDYLLKQKAAGRIRHLGFSAHGSIRTMRRFLEAYGEHMEFCQIQLNWLDWSFQNAKGKVELLREYGLPVWAMEPVRGGKLASLSPEYEARLKGLCPGRTMAEWAFRFIESTGAVTVALSGMSNMEQLRENVETYSAPMSLTREELEALEQAAKEMTSRHTLPCTACRYCTSYCPQGLDIPWLLELYNEYIYSGGSFIAVSAVSALPEDKRPPACIGCKSCEAVCPQRIGVAAAMADFAQRLRG